MLSGAPEPVEAGLHGVTVAFTLAAVAEVVTFSADEVLRVRAVAVLAEVTQLHREAAPQTQVAVAVEPVMVQRLQAALVSSLFATQAHNVVQEALSHRLAATPITPSHLLGHLQHEPICPNRREQHCPARAGH